MHNPRSLKGETVRRHPIPRLTWLQTRVKTPGLTPRDEGSSPSVDTKGMMQ